MSQTQQMQEYLHLLCSFFALKHMHLHRGNLQHHAADGGESLLTQRDGEGESKENGRLSGSRKIETVRLEKGRGLASCLL